MIQFYIRGYIWNESIFLLFQFAPYASIQWYENSVQFFFFLILYRRLDLMLKKDILSIIQVCVWFFIQFSGRYLMSCLTLNLKIIATFIHLISIVIFFPSKFSWSSSYAINYFYSLNFINLLHLQVDEGRKIFNFFYFVVLTNFNFKFSTLLH